MGKILIGNFKGPKGNDGAQGAVGPAGPEGKQGPPGPAGGVNRLNGAQGDISLGLRNLVLDSAKEWKNKDYLLVHPDTTEVLRNGETYTVTICLTPASDVESLSVNLCHGSQGIGVITVDKGPVRQIVSTTVVVDYGTHSESEYYLNIYRLPQPSDASGETVIHWMTITHGNVQALEWFPAPEDIYTRIPQMHRNIFRGRNLGSTFTDAQKAAIAAGTFEDLYVGDYWTMSDRTWRIADFDYYMNRGDYPNAVKKHHIVVVPDSNLYLAQMQNSESGIYDSAYNTTEGGYYNSSMRQENLSQAKEMVKADFGADHLLKPYLNLTNAVKDGYASAGASYESEVDLMNENMVFGTQIYTPMSNGTILPWNSWIEFDQLALFRLVPAFILAKDGKGYWLRDISSKTNFTEVHPYGHSASAGATNPVGVRPAVGIIGA